VQLAHPGGAVPVSGTMIFHRAGVPGAPGDSSLTYTLQPNQVVTYPDVLPSMGLSGLGSLDFVGAEDEPVPVVSARVFNDAGAAGTSGLSEPLVSSINSIIKDERHGTLITPVDPVRTRYNIGVRTLEDATVTFTLYDATGVAIAATTRSYPATYFEQVNVESLLGAISGSQMIRIRSTGEVIVYGSTTDNTTNDPSLEVATVSPVL
jgi:hypothetical protein